MHGWTWRVGWPRRYLRDMAKPRKLEPERRLAALKGWEGKWVAVKDGEVIAAAHNSRDLVPQLVAMGEKGRGAVAQFVPWESDVIVIGVG